MSDLKLRPARPGDKDAVDALSAHIWDGEDYVPDRFSEWIADERGQFTVACRDDRLLGFGKLTQLRPGEWWLEGLRVDPAYRQQGVAQALHQHAVDLADEIGTGTLRFGTVSTNIAVHKLAKRTGFHFVSAHLFAGAEVDAEAGDPGRVEPVTPTDVAACREWLQRSRHFAAGHGLYEQRWTWLEILPRLEQLQREGQLYWWLNPAGAHSGILILTQPDDRPDILRLNYLDVPITDLHDAAGALRALAPGRGRQRVKGKPMVTETITTTLAAQGWTVNDEQQLWVFERPLKQGTTFTGKQ